MKKLRFRASYPNKDEYSNKPWNTAFIIFCCSDLTTKNPDVIDKAKLSGIVVYVEAISNPWNFKLHDITFNMVRL